ncbi:response regulator transcription factor [Luteolibacter yonseiensis]|uniref:Response regulator transcription factor n=1 Tax=Luteolibacter yonseiensis TaxID=1144680 RepID=A0A934QZY3_9BACT|nr:response regulator [Luteolibacter yonseiensis]MBK1814184.1 response regulator transcription factor [Luteolibacter yonseiensis]
MKTPPPPNQVVYLVDDDEGLRSAMCRLLRAEGFETRAYASAADFLMFRDEVLRGCIIIDVRMPGGPSGLELHQSLLRKSESLPVIFLTGHGSIPMSVQAIKSGAFDFLAKPTPRSILVATVRAALDKESEAWAAGEKRRDLARRRASLTETEHEVYQRVVAGLPNKLISMELGSAERTVKAHRSSVMKKMGALSVADLVHMSDLLQEPAE